MLSSLWVCFGGKSLVYGNIFLVFLLVFGVSNGVHAQAGSPKGRGYNAPPHSYFFRFDYHFGHNVSTSQVPWLQDLFRSSYYRAGDFRLGIQTSERQPWARYLNYPRYGLGFASFYFQNEEVDRIIGDPEAFYLFGAFPLWRNPRFHLNFDMAGGVMFNLNPYDPETNPFNDAIGSNLLAYFDFGFGVHFQIARLLDLSMNANLVHFSNGRVRTPNRGINLVGAKIGLAWYLVASSSRQQFSDFWSAGESAALPQVHPTLPVRGSSYWNFSAAIGVSSTLQGDPVEGKNIQGPSYFIAVAAADRAWQYSHIAAASLGLNLHYDGSLGEFYPGRAGGFLEKSTIGLTLGHELFLCRLGFLLQLGYYPFLNSIKREARGHLYLRTGLRWRFSQRWWCYAALKTMDGPVADFIEWGVGYSLISSR